MITIDVKIEGNKEKKMKLFPLKPSSSQKEIKSIWNDMDSNLLTIKQYSDNRLQVFAKDYSIITNNYDILDLFPKLN